MKKKLFLSSVLALCIFGINTIVNAESYVVDSAPDTITTKYVNMWDSEGNLSTGGDFTLANSTISAQGQNIIDYHTKDNKKTFCIDRKIGYAIDGDIIYTRTDETVAYPIVYIIVNSDAYYKELGIDGVTETNQKLEQSWMTQAAIWLYNAEKDDTDNFENIQSVDTIISAEGITMGQLAAYTYSTRADKLWTQAKKLVEDAKKATDPSTTASLSFNYDGKHTVDKDNKTIKTGLISLQTSGIVSYSLDLSKVPTGTKVYGENNQEISDLTNIRVRSFYLVIPVENIDNYTYDFNLPIKTDSYTYYKGYKYTTEGNGQPLTLVTKEAKPLNTVVTIKASHLEDTASSISNSIYFVGFLILVSGVGIIYVSTRKQQQQI